MTEALGLRDTYEHRRWNTNIPAVAAETIVVPVPHTHVPAQAANVQFSIRMAINRAPEANPTRVAVLIDFPVFGDDLGMSQQVVENAGVQKRNLVSFKFLAELATHDTLAVFLVFREVELKSRRIEFEHAITDMLLNRPLIQLPRLRHAIACEVDDMLHDLHSAMTAQNRKDLCSLIACTQGLDVCRTISRTTKSHF